MANAVLDGVDGILLGAETLRGKYAVQTVQTILAICHQAEKAFDHNYHFEHLMQASCLSLSLSSTSFLMMLSGGHATVALLRCSSGCAGPASQYFTCICLHFPRFL